MAIELSEQEQLRRQSLTALRNLGIEPYPAARYEVTATAREIADNYDDAKKNFQDVRIAGRIMSRRIMGSASFFELQDHTGRIQVYIRRDDICPEGDPTLYNTVFKKLLDIGDFIGVEGFAFHTNTGELSVHCRKFTVLSKSIRPLPVVKEKDGKTFDAFTDPEVRYRQRYLDLIVNPQVKETFVRRARIMATMREFFNERGYIEVETPILQPIPGGASARPFITHHNSLDIDLYLRIATELYLKKLIVGGFDGVYEFGKNFRNEGMDRTHNPEFTCMEIYVAYKDYLWMMEFTEQMLERVAMAVNGTTELTIDGKPISFKAPFRRLTMTDAIREKTGYDITGRSEEELREACKQSERRGRRDLRQGQADRRHLRAVLRGGADPAHLHHGLPARDVAAVQASPLEPRPDGAFRTVRQRQGAVQRLFGAERPDRPAGAFPGAAASARRRATTRRCSSTWTSCAHWNTACRPARAWASASTA